MTRTIRDRSILFLIERPQSAQNKQGYVDPCGYLLVTADRLRHHDRVVQPYDYRRSYDEDRGVLVDSLRLPLRAKNDECLIDLATALAGMASARASHEHCVIPVAPVLWSDDWDHADDVPRELVYAEAEV